MKKYQFIYYLSALLVVILLGKSPVAAQKIFKATPVNISPAEAAALNKVFKRQTVVQLDAQSVYQYVKQAGNKSNFIIDAGRDYYWNILLEQHDLRSGDYIAQRSTKDKVITLPHEDCQTYAGLLKENTNEYVRLNIHSDKLSGNIIYHGASVYIEPLRKFISSAPINKYVIYKRGDSRPVTGFCGKSSTAEQQVNDKVSSLGFTQAADCRKIEVATESDWENFLQGVTAADILDNLNFVEPLYQNYYGAAIIVKYQHEWATFLDPYNSITLCEVNDRLGEFRTYWQANYTWVKRDISILYSGVDFTGNVIGCSGVGTFANSTGDDCYFAVEWKTSYNDEGREVLVAHEMGHTFGCVHDTGSACAGNNGPIMCPNINASCTDNCTPYWSLASINAISASILSANGSYRLRTREFFLPVNTALLFGISLNFSGNDLYVDSTYNIGDGLFGSGSVTYTGTDDVTLQPGFSTSVSNGAGAFSAIIGSCDINGPLHNGTEQNIAAKTTNASGINNTAVRVYPNPFNISTTIELDLPKTTSVSVSVYDMKGRMVDKPVINRQLPAGINKINYNNIMLTANVYLFLIEADDKQFTEKVIKM